MVKAQPSLVFLFSIYSCLLSTLHCIYFFLLFSFFFIKKQKLKKNNDHFSFVVSWVSLWFVVSRNGRFEGKRYCIYQVIVRSSFRPASLVAVSDIEGWSCVCWFLLVAEYLLILIPCILVFDWFTITISVWGLAWCYENVLVSFFILLLSYNCRDFNSQGNWEISWSNMNFVVYLIILISMHYYCRWQHIKAVSGGPLLGAELLLHKSYQKRCD